MGDDWTAEQWEGRARMADARRHAGLDLDDVDERALARYPDPPPSTTNPQAESTDHD